jgi:hypothetical protein
MNLHSTDDYRISYHMFSLMLRLICKVGWKPDEHQQQQHRQRRQYRRYRRRWWRSAGTLVSGAAECAGASPKVWRYCGQENLWQDATAQTRRWEDTKILKSALVIKKQQKTRDHVIRVKCRDHLAGSLIISLTRLIGKSMLFEVAI